LAGLLWDSVDIAPGVLQGNFLERTWFGQNPRVEKNPMVWVGRSWWTKEEFPHFLSLLVGLEMQDNREMPVRLSNEGKEGEKKLAVRSSQDLWYCYVLRDFSGGLCSDPSLQKLCLDPKPGKPSPATMLCRQSVFDFPHSALRLSV
jgi:hypothetical protein